VRIFLTLALLAQVWAGSAQVYWSKQIDWGHNLEALAFLTELNKQHFLAAGGSLSLDPYYERAMLTRFDSSGAVQGNSVFLVPGASTGGIKGSVKLDHDHTLLMSLFYKDINGLLTGQIYLTKTNLLSGDTLWSKAYGKAGWHFMGREIKKTKDGGYAIVGKTFLATNQGHEKVILLKIDSNFNQVYGREYSTNASANERGWALIETWDGGFLLSCNSNYQGICPGCNSVDFMADLLLIKTDAVGNQQWVKKIPPWEWKQFTWSMYNITTLSDSSYLFVGEKGFRKIGNGSLYRFQFAFFKFSIDGSLVDSVSISGGTDALLTNSIMLSDSNVLAVGLENDPAISNIGQTGIILKIGQNLQLHWKKGYHLSPPGLPYYEEFYDAVEMPDKGFIICGRTYADSTNQNGWILRVDSFGCLEPGCQLNSAVEAPTIQEQDIGITLSPNPTSGQVNLALKHEGAVLLGVRVLDVQGRVVSDMQYLRSAGWRECVLDLSGEPAGVYVAQVRTSKGWGVRKIVKQ